MKYWFTADPHFGHANIIRLANRPFNGVVQMDNHIIDSYNRLVKPNDYLYILGDFSWGNAQEIREYRARIKCNNIIFIWGNHDKVLRKTPGLAESVFKSTHDILDLNVDSQTIVLCHYPFLEWNKLFHGSWHLFGHVHGNISHAPGSLAVDVGVDVQNFEPVDYEQLKVIMERRKRFNARSIRDVEKESENNNASNTRTG